MSRLLAAAGQFVDRIKINALSREVRGERMYWFKRRRPGSRWIIELANQFFRTAGNPVVILVETAEWRRWEVHSLTLLHGQRFHCIIDPDGALGVEEIPGRSLSDHLNAGTITPSMAVAAARELRRAHDLPCPELSGHWSHGDAHSGNFLFDPNENRAWLMDFEVRHVPALSEHERHADDLLVLLQDTLGRMPRESWLEWGQAFVEAYDRPAITRHLLERLTAPKGLARLWWAVRTTYVSPRELHARLTAIRTALAA